ncbi:hypothetical protein SDC9_88529 [bioreactor metagenome]|uniref:Uncharacterized protein n=1 Tax=bioreactor metagenome TaxID=1076179 RepID=A0A644ZLS9_9ZZZZ
MRGVPGVHGHRGRLVRVEAGRVTGGAVGHEGAVPLRVEVADRGLAAGERRRALDHPALARLPGLGGGAAAVDQPLPDGGRGGVPLRHRRVVGEPAGGDQQHPLVQRRQVVTDRLAHPAHPPHRHERPGDAVDEDRHDRLGPQPAEQGLQRLHGTVVDVHPAREGQVDVGLLGVPDDGQRLLLVDRERAGLGVVVTDRGGGEADGEGRHQVVEEAVVVVRREDDDQRRVVLGGERVDGVERGVHPGTDLGGGRQFGGVQERAVGHGHEGERHVGSFENVGTRRYGRRGNGRRGCSPGPPRPDALRPVIGDPRLGGPAEQVNPRGRGQHQGLQPGGPLPEEVGHRLPHVLAGQPHHPGHHRGGDRGDELLVARRAGHPGQDAALDRGQGEIGHPDRQLGHLGQHPRWHQVQPGPGQRPLGDLAQRTDLLGGLRLLHVRVEHQLDVEPPQAVPGRVVHDRVEHHLDRVGRVAGAEVVHHRPRLLVRVADQGGEQRVLVLEVPVEGARVHPGLLLDHRQGGALVAAFGRDAPRRVEDPLPGGTGIGRGPGHACPS